MEWAAFDALRQYKKAARRFSAANPTAAESRKDFDRAYRGLHRCLHSPEIVATLEQHYSHTKFYSQAAPVDDFNKTKISSKDIDFELSLANNFGFSKHEALKLIDSIELPEAPDQPLTAARLTAVLNSVHAAAVGEVERSRELPKKEKKKRKRDVLRGVFFVSLGGGIAIANTLYVLSLPVSYGVAMGSLLQALKDFIGDKQ